MTTNVRKYGMIFAFILIALFNVTNCVTALGNVTITGKNYPPLAETDPIDVIMRAVPDYRVEQIGIVEVRCGQLNHCIEYVKGKARESGADVIILAESGSVTSVNYHAGTQAGNTSTPGRLSFNTHQVQTWELAKKIKPAAPSPASKGKKSVSDEV
ncbi:LA_1841 family salt-regulated protein [Leptospira sanjuanensis]|uniref:LA_1841 family salt-regulated protein n=1 Tax=Leptospira sanjuanensis TaxID=2879643 RepID=UPI003873419C